MSITSLSAFLGAIVVLALAGYIFWRNQRSTSTILFVVFAFGAAVWLYASSMLFISKTDDAVLFWDRIVYTVVVFMPVILFHFSLEYTRLWSRLQSSILLGGYICASIFFALLHGTEYFIHGAYYYSWGAHSQAGSVHHIFLVFFAFYMLLVVVNFYQAQRLALNNDEKLRHQLSLLAILILNSGSVGFMSAYGFSYYPVTYITGVLFIVIIAYAMIKYKFMSVGIYALQIFILVLMLISFVDIFIPQLPNEHFIRIFLFCAISLIGILIIRNARREIKQKMRLETLTHKLKASNKEWEKLDAAKSEFISIASHQLRTPLTAIKGYISLIMEGSYGETKPTVTNVLEKIYQSNERLIMLVEELLNISRIESGTMRYHFERVDLVALVNEVEDLFTLRAKEKNIALVMALPSKTVDVWIDPSKIREVISNVIDNAIKYTEEGFVRVEVIQKHNRGIVVITDTGIGIPREVMPQLFSKFSRGKDQSRLHVDGTGLGLYVGKNIVEANKGKIHVASDGSGKGSRFIIELPLVKDEL